MKNKINFKMFGDEIDVNSEVFQEALKAEVEKATQQVSSNYAEQIEKIQNNNLQIIEEKKKFESKYLEASTKLSELSNNKDENSSVEEIIENERKKMSEIIENSKNEALEYKNKLADKDKEVKTFMMKSALQSEISKNEDFETKATSDATNIALSIFNDFDEKGQPVIREASGVVKLNNKGQVYSIADFIESQKEERTYWFKQKSGSNLESGLSLSSSSMKKADFQKVMTSGTDKERNELKRKLMNNEIKLV